MAKLEVQIGADSSELNSEIAAAEAKIKKLASQKSVNLKMGVDNTALNRDITTAKGNLMSLKKSVDTTSDSFTKMKKPVQNGGNTLMQFSRIAQDAPFGIMGIGNNITATAESFGYLAKSSGGAGNALKAVASSMTGVGGILLAVSLVTSALTYMSQNGITVGDIYDKLTGKFDATAKAIRKVGEESSKSAGEEISSLKSLISVAQDDTLSRKNRMIAVGNLQKMYPAYFQNLTNEKILNGDLTNIVNDLSTALKARARASALSGKAGEAASKELVAQEKIRDVYKEIFDILKVPKSKQLQAINDLNKENLELNNKRFPALKKLSSLEILQLGRLKSEYTDLRGEISEAGAELNRFQELANKDTKASIKLEVTTKDLTGSKGLVKETVKREKQSFGGGFIPGGIVNPNLGLQNTDTQNLNIVPDVLPDITQKTQEIQDALLAFNENTNSIIGESIAGTFMNLGQIIGDALANGGNVLKAAGNALLGSIGGLLSAMGGELIKLGTAAVLAGTVTKLFGTTLGIGAGFAAIAGGTILSSVGSAMSSKANKGVSGFGGQGESVSTGGGYSSPSGGSYASSSGSGGGTVVFEISGQSLIGVLSNTLDRNTRLGGRLGIG